MKPTAGTKTIASLRRGLDVLGQIDSGQGATLHDLHKASLLRIVKTLEAAGRIQRRLADGAYLGRPAAGGAAADTRWHARLIATAAPALRDLHRHLPWPSDIAVRDGLTMRVLESNRSLSAITINRAVVNYHPNMLWTAMGRAYLAFCPPEERVALLAALRESASSVDRAARRVDWTRRLLAQSVQQGYAIRDPLHMGPDAGVFRRSSAIAVPVFAHGRPDGAVLACISCVWLTEVMDEVEVVDRYLGRLQQAASRIGSQLGAP